MTWQVIILAVSLTFLAVSLLLAITTLRAMRRQEEEFRQRFLSTKDKPE